MLNIKKLFTKLMTTESVTPSKVGSAWTSGTITAYRIGGTVTLKFSAAAISGVSSRTTIAKLPDGYKPPAEIVGKPDGGLYILVTPSGNIQVDPPAGGTYYVSVTFVAKLGGVYRKANYVNLRSLLRKVVVVC